MVRETVAPIIWLFAVTKVFVFDFDRLIVESFAPGLTYLLDYRLVGVLLVSTLLLIVLGPRRFLLLAGFTLVYPVVVLLWRVPYSLFRRGRWYPVLLYANTLVEGVLSIKRRLVLSSLLALGLVLCLVPTNSAAIYAGCSLIAALLVLHYVGRIGLAFRPTRFLAVDSEDLLRVFNDRRFQQSLDNLGGGGSSAEPEAQGEHKGLDQLLLLNRVFLFFATNLRRFRDSRHYVLASLVGLTITLTVSILGLATISFGLFRADASHFRVSTQGTYIDFVYFSAASLLGGAVQIVEPATSLARWVELSHHFAFWVLVVLVATVLITTRSERFRQDLDKAIDAVEEQGDRVEDRIKVQFSITADEAVVVLEQAQYSLIGLVRHLNGAIGRGTGAHSARQDLGRGDTDGIGGP